MSARGYEEMSASEVIADLHGPGYKEPDTGEVWDGEQFQPPGYMDPHRGELVDSSTSATAKAKKKAREEYLEPFENRIKTCKQRVEDAISDLRDAENDLERAKVNADRWYRHREDPS